MRPNHWGTRVIITIFSSRPCPQLLGAKHATGRGFRATIPTINPHQTRDCVRSCAYRVGERVGPLSLLSSVSSTIGVFFGLGVTAAKVVACGRSELLAPMSLKEVSTREHSLATTNGPQQEPRGRYSDATEFSHPARASKINNK